MVKVIKTPPPPPVILPRFYRVMYIIFYTKKVFNQLTLNSQAGARQRGSYRWRAPAVGLGGSLIIGE